ncbi:MAG TPA: hypothetical protein VN659_10215 [Pyrinomonadaceae bacterium]|jgi:hypothetical protein|nr:hypothetical protein [Pyrinomonadaceae bacterium]
MRASASLLALILIFGVAISCKLSEKLAGDKNAGTVSELWTDVPPFQGATKAEIEIPLGMRLLIRGMTQGKVNFISFRTDKTAQEVKDFYSVDRMKAVGWIANDKGCTGDTEDTKNHGALCLFSKKNNGKEEALAIIVAQDEKLPDTNIFYARVDTTNSKK